MNLIVSYSAIILFISTPSALDDVRRNFAGINSIEEAEETINRLQLETSLESKGYAALMNFIKSHYFKFPFTKMKYFKRGKKALDELIVANPENIEIRYIRFLMQKQVPKFLGYHKHIDEDFKLIVKGIEEKIVSYKLCNIMLTNMLAIENLSAMEKEQLEHLLNES